METKVLQDVISCSTCMRIILSYCALGVNMILYVVATKRKSEKKKCPRDVLFCTQHTPVAVHHFEYSTRFTTCLGRIQIALVEVKDTLMNMPNHTRGARRGYSRPMSLARTVVYTKIYDTSGAPQRRAVFPIISFILYVCDSRPRSPPSETDRSRCGCSGTRSRCVRAKRKEKHTKTFCTYTCAHTVPPR